jgi:hypothetical protein
MKPTPLGKSLARRLVPLFALALATFLLGAGLAPASSAPAQSSSDKTDKKTPPPTTRLKIEVTNPYGKPVGQASVYVRFPESGGVFHKDKLAEMDLKTNDDGSVKVPDIPQGKIMIQVIAKGWRTYGCWYDIEKDEDTIQIKLEAPPHWY